MAYRESRGTTLGIFVGIVLAVGGQIFLLSRPEVARLQAWALAVCVAWVFLVIGVGVALLQRHQRRRASKNVAALARLGFVGHASPTEAEREEFWGHVRFLQDWYGLQHGASALTWFARLDEHVFAFEHVDVVGSGRSTSEYKRTVLLWRGDTPGIPAGPLAARDLITLNFPTAARRHWLLRTFQLHKVERRGLKRGWLAEGPTAAVYDFLTDVTVEELNRSPQDEIWTLGGGWIVLNTLRVLDAPNLLRFYNHGRRALGEFEPERYTHASLEAVP